MGDRLPLMPTAATLLLATALFVATGCSQPTDPDTDLNDNECESDELSCGGECIDPDTAPNHCGECYNHCPAADDDHVDRVCIDGTCGVECTDKTTLCPSDETDGPGICVDTADDPDHCGECTNTCGPAPNADIWCDDGDCRSECRDGYTDCDGDCVDIDYDLRHCGACDNDCDTDQGCQHGQCVDEVECIDNQQPFGAGRGTEVQPYLICTFEHLDRIDTDADFADAHFEMRADLDFADQPPGFRDDFAPLFQPPLTGDGFRGYFDGNGHSVDNLEFEMPLRNEVGLFEAISADGIVTDLTMISPDIEGRFSVGALVGDHRGLIEDVTIEDASVRGLSRIGAVAGHQGAWLAGIHHVEADGEATGARHIGGIVGRARDGYIHGAEAAVDVSATEQNAGGLAGTFAGSVVEAVRADGDVTLIASATTAGGLVGGTEGEYDAFDQAWTTRIDSARATGEVVGTDVVGGFVGDNRALIEAAEALGPVVADSNAGGFAGINDGGVIRQSFATSSVTPQPGADDGGRIGGFAGVNDGRLTDTYALGDIQGGDNVGGLVGLNDAGASIQTSYSFGQPAGPGDTGGLVATTDDASESTASYWNIDTSGTTDSSAGQGLTSGQFADSATFTDPDDNDAPWDFDETWSISLTEERPVLQWED